MNRKTFIQKSTLLALGASSLLSSACTDNDNNKNQTNTTVIAPNIQTSKGKKYRWKMVTTFPPNFPILGESASMFADWVKVLTDERIDIKVYGAGELVPALEVFDAVSSGTVEMGNGTSFFWSGKLAAAPFFTAVPFGMNAQQMQSWLINGDGYELWKEAYAPFNLLPFLGGSTGVQMGGWFRKEINSIADIKGLKMRMPGLGGMVLQKAGATAMTTAGSEIYTNLEKGVIDATEWVGPYHDYLMGFHKIAPYYYSPGWHEPSGQTEFTIHKPTYEQLPTDLKEALFTASMRIQAWMLGEFDRQNSLYLAKILEEGKVKLRTFPKEVLSQFRILAKEVLEEVIEEDAMSRKIYGSYRAFQKSSNPWYDLTEGAYYGSIKG